MWVLGINWEWHDSAAALVDETGRTWAFAEEERFTRHKHAWGSFPARAAAYCLSVAGIGWRDLDVIAVGWDIPGSNLWHYPQRDRERLLAVLFGAESVGQGGPEIAFVEHHVAHALSAFHASGMERAGVLVIDGSGESYASSIFAADRAKGLKPLRRWPRGFSLGALYEATTRSLGLGMLETGKTMGLAPYGVGDDTRVLPLGDVIEEGIPFFGLHHRTKYSTIVDAWADHLTAVFGKVTRPSAELDQDPVAVRMATSAQRTVEIAVHRLYAETVALTGHADICLAGGVALNSVANGRLPGSPYIPPFPHDAGVALGAAWSICPPTRAGPLASPYLGTDLAPDGALDASGLTATDFVPEDVVRLLLDGQIGAVAEGRAEAGPRALGHRSIVALPRDPETKSRLNRLKNREPWRPFAPVTLDDYAATLWPRQGHRELYMIGNAVVSSEGRRVMPAAVHVDGTTRPQVLVPGAAPVVESLLSGLRAAGAPPVLVNTSFNDRGEPIVDSAADAVRTFGALGLDFLVLGDHLVQRAR